MIHDRPAFSLPAELETEVRLSLDGAAFRPLPPEGERSGLDGEAAEYAYSHRSVLHHPQLGQPGQVVLKGGNEARSQFLHFNAKLNLLGLQKWVEYEC